MGTIKDRNSRDLTEAEDTRRGGKNTQNYKKKNERKAQMNLSTEHK